MEAWQISRIHLSSPQDKSRYSDADARRSHASEYMGLHRPRETDD
jgi:hypothetical protein